MITMSLLLLVLVTGVESINCPAGQQPCGSANCYDPTIQACTNSSSSIQCINSCNGTCYSSSQYCYNNTLICNNGQSVCDVHQNSLSWATLGLTCYDPTYYCINNTLCYSHYTCGMQCMIFNYACANNQTFCPNFYFWNQNVDLCGAEQQCYDNTVSICLNGTTLCPIEKSQLCESNCMNPNIEHCVNGTIQCINSCNGICYSSSQYCYNNRLICNNGQSVCDVQQNSLSWATLGLTCYDPAFMTCINNTLCYSRYTCGIQCMIFNYACANNQTFCPNFLYWNRNVYLCGAEQQCYDNTVNVCLGSNGTLCPIGSQLCSGVCYNPQLQYCVDGNNTVYCLANPSSVNCPLTSTISAGLSSTVTETTQLSSNGTAARVTSSTIRTTTMSTTRTNTMSTTRTNTMSTTRTTTMSTTRSTVFSGVTTSTTAAPSGSCCATVNCTSNADCCQRSLVECQCFRHSQTDTYGLCINPNATPACANNCPVQGRCKLDSDCCKCQCAAVTFTDSSGNKITRKQCVQR